MANKEMVDTKKLIDKTIMDLENTKQKVLKKANIYTLGMIKDIKNCQAAIIKRYEDNILKVTK